MGDYLIRILQDNTRISKNGQMQTYNTGDWLTVGKQGASSLVSQGKAEMKNYNDLLKSTTETIGVYVPAGELLELELFFDVSVTSENLPGSDSLEDLTIVLDKGYCFKSKKSPDVIRNPVKFSVFIDYLKLFDVVLILRDFNTTVAEESRELEITKSYTFDNRVLGFQTCVVGVKNTKYGREFLEVWQEQKEHGEFQALVRAHHIVHPRLYVFPPDWGIES